jgi:ubiquinone/menaquinone biosynthesis C-methylase UbiE
MLVIGLDCDPGMLAIARTNTVESGRVELVLGDVGSLPFRGESIDLVVSRGSIYFWDDRPAVFADIERVLAPGGTAFCGGGFGTAELRERIFAEMRRRNPRWDEDVRRRSGRADPETLRRELRQSGVAAGDLVEDESGTWVRIRKA